MYCFSVRETERIIVEFDHEISVSVIIPYHVVGENLYRCINSAIQQTFAPTEIILVSDGCRSELDDTKILSSDVKIVKLRIKKNSGPACARNLGLRHSTGSNICFLDSDDFWHIKKIEQQISKINEFEGCDTVVVVSPVRILDEDGKNYCRFPRLSEGKKTEDLYLRGPFMYLGSSGMWKRSLLHRVGFQNESMRVYEDFEWQIRMVCECEVQFVSTDKPSVFIQKIRKPREIAALKENFLILLEQVHSLGGVINKADKYATAMFYLDCAKTHYLLGNYLNFLVFMTLSFLKVPRLRLHIEKFWLEGVKYSCP